jgi:hypothetical protein
MNANFQYQINGVGAPAMPRIDPDAPRYASQDGLVASLSNNECVFQVKRSAETHVMTYQVLQAMDQCREFRTLDEHAARIMTTLPALGAQREGVRRVLDNLVERELLVGDGAWLQRLVSAPARESAPLRAVFIRACDRPDQLERLLGSLTDYERQVQANRHYVLIDDSTTAAAVDPHRDLLREFARATGCKLTYVGRAEQERLVQNLAKAVPGAAAILPDLLLRPEVAQRFGGGRAWNIALLLSAGARLVLLDDDQCLPLRRLDEARPGLDPDPAAIGSAHFHRNIEEALGAGHAIAEDPFELHLEAAGQSLGTLAAGERYAIGREALRDLSLSRIDHLRGEAVVLGTLNGSLGSARTESGIWLYQLDAASRAELCADRDSYLRNVEAGSVWHGRPQARASMSVGFTPFALDNSELLPCTNAQGRGEDLLFSAVTRLIRPDALFLELPVAMGHVQESPRKRSPRTLGPHTPRFNHFVANFVQRQLPEFLAEAPARRLDLLAANLRDVAAASETSRINLLREYLGFVRADVIERMQQNYEAARDAPIYWQADVRTIIEANGRALVGSAPPRLDDWDESANDRACADALRDEANALAGAWEAWPALWEHARQRGAALLDEL